MIIQSDSTRTIWCKHFTDVLYTAQDFWRLEPNSSVYPGTLLPTRGHTNVHYTLQQHNEDLNIKHQYLKYTTQGEHSVLVGWLVFCLLGWFYLAVVRSPRRYTTQRPHHLLHGNLSPLPFPGEDEHEILHAPVCVTCPVPVPAAAVSRKNVVRLTGAAVEC